MTNPVLTATEQQLATLLQDKSVPESTKNLMAAMMKQTIELEKKVAAAEQATRDAEQKANQAKALKEAIANGPFAYIEAPGISKKNQPFPAKVAVNPFKGAHPFYGQIRMQPNEWRQLLAGCTDGEHVPNILKACDDCDRQYPVTAAK